MDPDDFGDELINGPTVATANNASRDKETVKVVVRCRPLFGKEITEGRKPIVTLDTQASIISIKCPENDQNKSFTFDSVYDETTTQRQFYDESAYPLVESIFEGYNGTIFAYGQTGCGKTHTMQGKDFPLDQRGVIPLSFDHIFENINADRGTKEYMVRVSYLEIYNEEIRDLLSDDSKKRLELKESSEGSIYVKDLTEVVVSDVDSMNKIMTRGFKNRTVGATLMNEGSSRSHSIFTVVIETSEKNQEGEERFRAGKLNLVDLAGSERQSKTGATGNRLKEGCKINLSLSALGNVISALVDGKGKHIPYRDSKLTRLLQDSLGGNTKTLMVAAVSPADYNYDETLSTLRYANRAKNIKNKPIVNEDPKDAKLREYKEEIERLRKLLEAQSRGSSAAAAGMANGLTGTTTPPVRPMSGTEHSDFLLAKEREEITKYQMEAAAMYEKAKRMMEDAMTLQSASNSPPSTSGSGTSGTLGQVDPPLISSTSTTGAGITSGGGGKGEEGGEGEGKGGHHEDEIKKALEKAAEVDSKAREMMQKAQQMMREAEKRALEPSRVQVIVKEVIPEKHLKEKEDLSKLNQNILDQHEKMSKELEKAQQEMEKNAKEKADLDVKLRKIASQILGGNHHQNTSCSNLFGIPSTSDTEVALLKQQVEYRRTQIKLKQKMKQQLKFEAQKKALTLEKELVQEELNKTHEIAQQNLNLAKKKN